jgi:lambda family phage minor tail protein L
MTSSVFEDLISSSPYAIIELFEIELRQDLHGSDEIYRFHNGVNQTTAAGDVVWKGNSYYALPIEAEGFEYNGNGQLPRPKIRVANLLGSISAILININDETFGNDLTGAKVTRIRTLSRFLDAVNFPGGVNPYGTPSDIEFPKEVYYVDRKTVENRDVVEFELAAAFDLAGVRAPKRQCIANLCQWVYRSAECGYTGTNYFDENDTPLNSVPATNWPSGTNTLSPGTTTFVLETQLVSSNQWFRWRIGSRGNVFVQDKAGNVVWSANTQDIGGYRLEMESNGNLRLLTTAGVSVWRTGTAFLGTPVTVTYQNWEPTDIRAGRNGSFFHEVLGNADSYAVGTTRTANYTFTYEGKTMTLQLAATCELIPAEEASLYPSATNRWRQTSGSGAAATVISSTGLWKQDTVFKATVTTALSNPFRSPVGYGTLITVSAVYTIASVTGTANRAVIENNGNLRLLNSSDAVIWETGINNTTEPRVISGTGDPLNDVCGKRLSSCKVRFGENAELPFGSFPGVGASY